MASRYQVQVSLALFTILSLVACGNGGSIEFRTDVGARRAKGIGATLAPASLAQSVEFGQTPATGHSAKLQINPIKGTVLSGGGYTAKMKHTARNR